VKLIVLISLESSWSRDVIKYFIKKGVDIYALDMSARNGYQARNKNQKNTTEVEDFKSTLAYYEHISDGNSLFKIIKCAFAIRKLKSTYGISAIFSCYAGMSAAAAFLSFIRPYYIYIVGSDVLYLNLYKKLLYKYSFSNASIIFSNGEHLIDHTKRFFSAGNYRLNFIGINTSVVNSHFIAKPYSSKLKFICTRGFEDVYNNLFILKSFALLPAETLEKVIVTFTSAGDLLQEAKQYALSAFSDSLLPNFVFLGGISYESIITQLCESDIYLSLSFSDGISLSLLEAMHIGLFPVVSDIDGNREVVNDGIFVSPFSEIEFSAVLADIINKRSTFENFNPAVNKQLVKAEFNLADNIEKVYTAISGNINSTYLNK
jgi:glycosyltransferase involved in cell wall biosynthesis